MHRRACIRQEALLGPFVLLSITLVRAGLTLMVLCGTYLLLGGELSILVFVLFLVVGSRVFDPLTSALTNFTEFRYFSIAGGRILTLMNEPEMKGERQSPAAGNIRFEHVSFAYQDKEVLHDITVTLPQNSLTALVGPSGSGKSTLMKLCARFYDPQQGRISFGGVPMDEIAPESLMSPVPGHDTQQHPFRQDGCSRRGNHCRRQESLLSRLHHALAARLRHNGW